MRTAIYIDWNNLYYGVIKHTPYWWLDLPKLFESLLKPHHEVVLIKIFTAKLPEKIENQFAAYKQTIYHDALSSYDPKIKFYFGEFMKKTIQVPAAFTGRKNQILEFPTYEEKGTDVNLALQMLNDSWLNIIDCAVLVSNDKDFAGALELIKSQNGKKIGLFTPGLNRVSFKLQEHANFNRRIKKYHLKANQLPNPIPVSNISKPRKRGNIHLTTKL